MTDYLASEKEKHPDYRKIFGAIATSNKDPMQQRLVFDALNSFFNFAHAFDDLVDGSNLPMEKKQLAWQALQQFTQSLLLNPFVTSNAAGIEAILTSGIARQVDADEMEKRGVDAKTLRAVRCADIDVIVHMARLAGGWDAMRNAGKLARYYDTDVEVKS
jgi:hypothetical protein